MDLTEVLQKYILRPDKVIWIFKLLLMDLNTETEDLDVQ